MFKVGDLVKLKPGSLIKTDGFASQEHANNFLKKELFIVKEVKESGLIGLEDPYPYFGGDIAMQDIYFFDSKCFVIEKSIDSFNLEKPYTQLTKLEYAAIRIFASVYWDMSDEYRKNVIKSAKKLLEECNEQ